MVNITKPGLASYPYIRGKTHALFWGIIHFAFFTVRRDLACCKR
jgi:hypothetical protein